jgi:hypothetical protein
VSYELIFVPRMLGQSWAEALEAAARATEITVPTLMAARLDAWKTLLPKALSLLEGAAEYRGARYRELHHRPSGLRLAFFGEDAAISLPYWHVEPADTELVTTMHQLALFVEEQTGLAGFEPQLHRGLHGMSAATLLASYRTCRAEFEVALAGYRSGSEQAASGSRDGAAGRGALLRQVRFLRRVPVQGERRR